MATAQSSNIEYLNGFLRGEITAAETYRIALERLKPNSTFRNQLEAARSSHLERETKLQAKIREIGGAPESSGGVWGAFAKAVESGATMLGDKVAVSALEEGEDRGLREYRDDLGVLPVDVQQLVTRELLPKQVETHRILSELKSRLAAT